MPNIGLAADPPSPDDLYTLPGKGGSAARLGEHVLESLAFFDPPVQRLEPNAQQLTTTGGNTLKYFHRHKQSHCTFFC